jgi:RNA polymerase sigma-70 factor (sigma-E family)
MEAMVDTSADHAVEQLYAAAWVPMVRLATLLLGDQSRAEDIVQEALIGLHRRWGGLEDPTHATAYLRRSVVNGVRSAQRHSTVAERHLRAEAGDPTLPQVAAGADVAALARDQRALLLDAVAALPQRQREVLTLRYWSDLSEAEIADTLGISTGSVKTHAHRALAALATRREDLA